MSQDRWLWKKKIHALLEREGMTSLMNNTRWRETIEALQELPLRYRVQSLMAEQVSEWDWLQYGHIPLTYVELASTIGPILFLSIEWLELTPQEKLTAEARATCFQDAVSALRALKVPFNEQEPGEVLRIWGHIRGDV